MSRTQAARHWTHRALVREGEAVFGHICHEERGPELVLGLLISFVVSVIESDTSIHP